MRVGVYIDGYNLYYGGRGICGRGVAGWRWLDLRSLCADVIAAHSGWPPLTDLRVVYCTARIKGADNAHGQRDQDVYLRALSASGSADVVEYGTYVSRTTTAPLATKGPHGKPRITTATWPIVVKDATGAEVNDAWFMASVACREEKGSDVNVAAHVLVDVLQGDVDAVVVISNDSDLRYPIEVVRDRVPVGLVNPTSGYPAAPSTHRRTSASANTGGTSSQRLTSPHISCPQRLARRSAGQSVGDSAERKTRPQKDRAVCLQDTRQRPTWHAPRAGATAHPCEPRRTPASFPRRHA